MFFAAGALRLSHSHTGVHKFESTFKSTMKKSYVQNCLYLSFSNLIDAICFSQLLQEYLNTDTNQDIQI